MRMIHGKIQLAGKECINKPVIHKTNIHLYHLMFMAFEVFSIAKS